MKTIKEIWDSLDLSLSDINTPFKLLKEYEETINNSNKNCIRARVIKHLDKDKIYFELHLIDKKGVHFKYIKFQQLIDSIYPINIFAFANPMQYYKIANNAEENFKCLEEIMIDQRTKILFNQLSLL